MLGYSPLKSAVALIPVAALVMPVSIVTPRLVARIGLKIPMGGGLLFLAAGMFWVSRLHTESGYLPFLAGLLLAGIGIGLTNSTGTSAIVTSLGPDRQGVASAMNDTSREVGAALGIAVMGSVFSSQYRNHLPDLTRLPTDAAEAVRHSAAAGLQVADRIGPQGKALTHAVRDSFMNGFTAATAIAAAILTVAAIGALLRAPRTLEEHEQAEDHSTDRTPTGARN